MILADAIHDAGDAAVLISMFFVDFFSKKSPTKKFNYGFRRLSVIGAVVTSGLILLGSYQLARYVYYEFVNPHFSPYVNVPGLMAVSVVGVLVNFWSAKKLYGSKNLLDKAIFTHMLEDLLGWIMAFLSSILIWVTGFHQIDRVMSLVVLLMVAWSAIDVVVKSVKVLLNSAPSVKEFEKLEQQILALEGALEIENSHFWSLDGEQNVYTARIFIKKGAKIPDLRKEILKIVNNIEPDLVLIGHSDLMSPTVLRDIKQQFPQTKIAFWYVDPLYLEQKLGFVREFSPYLDAIF
jgi:cobalt-zinc-cadmium efflux system protein